MAISWGAARETSTNGVRVGVDVSTSTSAASVAVVADLWVWTKQASFNSSSSYEWTGNVWSDGGTFSYNHPTTTSSGWSTNNRTRIASRTITLERFYGQARTVTIGGRVNGSTMGGNIPSGWTGHSVTFTIPARAYNPPAAPSGVQVTRISDTQTLINWTRNNPNSSSAPYQTQRLQRRVLRADGSWSGWSTRVSSLSGSVSEYTDSTAANNRYQYRVRSANTGGVSSWATSPTIETTPAPPTNVSVQVLSSGNRVRWSRGARFPVRTLVERQEGSGSWSQVADLGTSVTEWVHSSPDPAVTHRYRVRHESSSPVLRSGYVTTSRVELAAPPAAPTNLGPSSAWDATEDRVLTWRHVPTDGSEQTGYRIRRRLVGGSWVVVGSWDTSDEFYVLPGDTYENGDEFEWSVCTRGVHPDWGPWSPANLQTPTARPVATINTPVEAEVLSVSEVTVSWEYDQEQGLPQTRWVSTLRDQNGEILVRREGGAETSVTYQLDNHRTYQAVVDVQASNGLWFRGGDEPVTFSTDFLEPQAPSIGVDWDVDTGAAVVEIVQPVWDEGHAEPSHHQLWRAIDDGPWLLIADDIPVGSTVTDPIPAMGDGHVNYYRAVTVSVLPSTADSEVVTLTVPSGWGGNEGWLYINGGPGMSVVCRVRSNLNRDDTEGVVKVYRQFSGRKSPVEYAGTAQPLVANVSAMVWPDAGGGSTRDELVELQALKGPVCLRSPSGDRWFGSMGQVSRAVGTMTSTVSFPFTRTDVTEGLDVVQRLPGELEPAL